MAPLGLFMTTIGALGGPGMMGDTGRVPIKPNFFWECSGDDLTPIPAVTDGNDMWDLDTADLNYTPQDDSTHVAEGYWEPVTSASPSEIQPISSPCS